MEYNFALSGSMDSRLRGNERRVTPMSTRTKKLLPQFAEHEVAVLPLHMEGDACFNWSVHRDFTGGLAVAGEMFGAPAAGGLKLLAIFLHDPEPTALAFDQRAGLLLEPVRRKSKAPSAE